MFNCSFSMIILLVIVVFGSIFSEDTSNLGKCHQEDLLLAECVEPHQIYITTTLSNITGQEVLDPIFMKNFVNFTKSITTCLGSELVCNAARHYKFFLDSLTFIGENLYDPTVFKCLESITPKIRQCLDFNKVYYQYLSKTNRYGVDLEAVVKCVIGEMKINLMCKNRKTIQAIGKSLNATRLMVEKYKFFKMNKMNPIVFSENLLN